MAESDVRVLVAEMRADQKAASEANRLVARELSEVAKELHSIGKAFTAQAAVVEELKGRVSDHESRMRAVEGVIISEKPFNDLRRLVLRSVAVFIVAGILGAVFIVNK